MLSERKDRASLIAFSSKEKTAAFAHAGVETDSCGMSLLSNSIAVTIEVLSQYFKYGLLFTEYGLRFVAEYLMVLLLCTLQAYLLQQPESLFLSSKNLTILVIEFQNLK